MALTWLSRPPCTVGANDAAGALGGRYPSDKAARVVYEFGSQSEAASARDRLEVHTAGEGGGEEGFDRPDLSILPRKALLVMQQSLQAPGTPLPKLHGQTRILLVDYS